MTRCATCNREIDGSWQLSFYGGTLVFDSFECALQRLAGLCRSCGCPVLGHGFPTEVGLYCSAACCEAARRLDRQVDVASADSFPASDPPAYMGTPPIAADPMEERRRREGGRVGWVLLWLLGVPLPLLLLLYLIRGCT